VRGLDKLSHEQHYQTTTNQFPMDKIKSHPTFQSYTSQKKRLSFLFYANFIFDWIIEQSFELKNWISNCRDVFPT